MLVVLAVIGGIVGLVVGGGDDDESTTTSPQVENLQDQLLTKTVVSPDAGISVRRPGDWTDKKVKGVISIKSKDSCLAMSLSAPTDKGNADTVRKQGLGFYKDTYKNVKVQPVPGSNQVGGISTTSNRITFNEKGHRIQVLLSVGTGKKNAYVTQVVIRDPQCQGDLQLAQLMLGTVQFTK